MGYGAHSSLASSTRTSPLQKTWIDFILPCAVAECKGPSCLTVASGVPVEGLEKGHEMRQVQLQGFRVQFRQNDERPTSFGV